MVQRIALGLLAIFAMAMGLNLISATSRFVEAFKTYDTLHLALTEFHYTDPSSPIETRFEVGNTSRRTIDVIAIELNLNVGVHRVGGGENRVLDTLAPGQTASYPVLLNIFDRDYVERRVVGTPDWRVRGRVMVEIDPAIGPVWINFVARYIPT
jgi:hypothetical protein